MLNKTSMYYIYVPKHEVADFVKLANELHCVVEVSHTNTNSPIVVSGKSLMGMLEVCLRGRLLMTFPNGYGEVDQDIINQILDRWGVMVCERIQPTGE